METQLKTGDTFIRRSKYGKVFGVVKSITSTHVVDDDCNYEKLIVISTNNVQYDYNECYKVTKKLNLEEIEKRKEMFSRLKNISERKSLIHEHIRNGGKLSDIIPK